MGKILTPEQMALKIQQLTKEAWPDIEQGLNKAANNVVGEAMNNCTPGRSPYYKAPYSNDNDPRRQGQHMKYETYFETNVDSEEIRATVYNKKYYAVWVHEGTYRMPPRPFILDAIKAKEDQTLQLLTYAIKQGLRRSCV